MCNHCDSVYDHYIKSPLKAKVWTRHGALTITVDRLRAGSSADVVAEAVCHIQPKRRDGARAGDNLLAGERRGHLFSQRASA